MFEKLHKRFYTVGILATILIPMNKLASVTPFKQDTTH